jgi:orotidine-5'-phosphate decarboxylase
MHTFPTAKDRLAVGLDVTGVDAARRMLDLVGDEAGIFKLGHRLCYSGGFGLIEELSRAGKQIFADLKLLDIDQTVAEGVKSVASTGAAYLTVHAYPKAMRAGVEALGPHSTLKLLGVTVLTSMDDDDLKEAGYSDSAEALVLKRAAQAKAAGMPGLICSAMETTRLRTVVGGTMLLVTPGIRFSDGDAGDQKRVVTPQKAIADGADVLVMARPIIAAEDPRAAARRAVEEIEAGLAERTPQT